MKKVIFFTVLLLLFGSGALPAQSLDWNIRGGLNLMKASSGSGVTPLYHIGFQAGVRITNWGFYGEMLYSVNENQYSGYDPIPYLIPAVVVKGFYRKHIFVEAGGCYLIKAGDSGVASDLKNPTNKLMFLGGLGVQFSKLQVSLRSTLQPSSSYGIIQLTAAIRF